MRQLILLTLAATIVGCASQPAPQPAPIAQSHDLYNNAVAAALVYGPPISTDAARIDLSREGRGQAAYWGYEDVTTTYYYLWQDDYQRSYGGHGRHSGQNDRFEREAITQRAGVSYR
jgi:hypothetical protein